MVGFKNGLIKIYDVRTKELFMKIEDKQGYGEVSSLAFSNKGLQFAATWTQLKDPLLFNLRKINDVQTPLNPFGEGTFAQSVCFDHFGNHLLSGVGNGISIYGGKTMSQPIFST